MDKLTDAAGAEVVAVARTAVDAALQLMNAISALAGALLVAGQHAEGIDVLRRALMDLPFDLQGLSTERRFVRLLQLAGARGSAAHRVILDEPEELEPRAGPHRFAARADHAARAFKSLANHDVQKLKNSNRQPAAG